MTTLIDSDRPAEADRLSELPHLPRDEGGPVFAEPWQAQAFALAVKLSEQGHYTWKEWAAALAHQLQAAARRGEIDNGSRYYEHWLAALESLVTAKGLADPSALLARKEAWADAYRNTPHGQPVELLQSRAPDARWLLLGLAATVTRLGYLLLFGVGSTVGMAALSGLLGWPIARLGANQSFARTVALAVGCVSTALGLLWGYPIIASAL